MGKSKRIFCVRDWQDYLTIFDAIVPPEITYGGLDGQIKEKKQNGQIHLTMTRENKFQNLDIANPEQKENIRRTLIPV